MKLWNQVPLSDLCEQDRSIIEPGTRQAKQLPYLSLEHVESKTGRILKEATEKIEDEGKSTTFLFNNGHVLYGKLRPYLNKVALPSFEGRCTTEIIPLLPSAGVDREYLAFLLRNGATIDAAMKGTTGSRMPRANMKELMRMEVPLPPLPEQCRLAALLKAQMAAVEQARKAAEERVEAAKKLESTLLHYAFGGIVPIAIEHSEVPAKGGWSWKLLTSLAKLESGHTPSRRHPEWWGGDVEWLQLSDVRKLDGAVAMSTGERTNELGLANSAARLLPAGTVCLSRTASVGFVTIMGREMATSQDFANWVCGDDADPRFLMYAFMASRHFFRDLSSGATHKTVYMPTIKSLVLHTPGLEEQRRIVALLDHGVNVSRSLVATASTELATLEALPGRLLAEVFGE